MGSYEKNGSKTFDCGMIRVILRSICNLKYYSFVVNTYLNNVQRFVFLLRLIPKKEAKGKIIRKSINPS